ncbi:MAG: polysaccharide deacetylase family protein [Clostridia bacterium]|nr:polysaccharide deacetylase family protein [Clostridia bacterium]
MSRIFLRFPDFKEKALTLSYDDGVRQDKRLISILDKYGIKATFNINAGLFNDKRDSETVGRMTKEEAVELYSNSVHEIANHGYKHLHWSVFNDATVVNDVIKDRSTLESIFGRVIKGMAYPNGSINCTETTVDILKKCGINYARTTQNTEKFDIPTDWLKMGATCHHNNPKLMQLAEEFLDSTPKKYFWANTPKLFYLWGHSYEFDNNNNWEVIEKFCEFVGGKEDVWYATNGEIYDYVTAFDRLEFSVDESLVYNPSAVDVYIQYYSVKAVIPAGKTVKIK